MFTLATKKLLNYLCEKNVYVYRPKNIGIRGNELCLALKYPNLAAYCLKHLPSLSLLHVATDVVFVVTGLKQTLVVSPAICASQPVVAITMYMAV